MELALQMHNNNKKAHTVAEAMLRNLITTVEFSIRSENFDDITLLKRCTDLQTRYFVNSRSIIDIESEDKLSDIEEIWNLIERIMEFSNITVSKEVLDVLYASFISQKNVVSHIPDCLDSMHEMAQKVKEFRNILPSPVYFQVRFKSYRSFIIKMLQKLEKSDLLELTSFHDFFAFKLLLMSYEGQEKQAINDAYLLFNDAIKLLISHEYALLPLKTVGPADERVNPMYAPFIKDYVKNPKMKYEIVLPDGRVIECFSKGEMHKMKEKYKEEIEGQQKMKKTTLYQALHAGFVKDGSEIEGQVTTNQLVKGIRSHSKFKRESRGKYDDIFDVSAYNLEGVSVGEEVVDFWYFMQPKFFYNDILRPRKSC